MGHLQTPSFLVSRTEFTPHPYQDNQLENSMVFVPVGLLLSDDELVVEEADEDISFCAIASPLLL